MKTLHSWDLSPSEAVALQNELRQEVEIQPLGFEPRLIAGADLSFNIGSDTVHAGIVVLSFPELEVVEECGVVTQATFPYVPGLLSFRESPAILDVWSKLKNKPDVLVLDGQGTAHPRRMGIACHIGLWLQIPTIGCGKTLLCGRYENLGEKRGDFAPLVHRKEVVGAALRTKDKVNPVFISPGHLCDLDSALSLILRCNGGLKIPEPTRRAHLFVNRLRRGES
jgi:deoxyribonuclease V